MTKGGPHIDLIPIHTDLRQRLGIYGVKTGTVGEETGSSSRLLIETFLLLQIQKLKLERKRHREEKCGIGCFP